jgi:hypothetical protein
MALKKGLLKKKNGNLHLVSSFKKFMDNIPNKEWPAGPPGETVFQPNHMGKMKTRDELVELQIIRKPEMKE